MKAGLLFTAGLLCVVTGVCAAEKALQHPAKIWQAVQTYDLITSKNLDAHTRELLAVKCSFRGKDIHHMRPNWYESSIWQPIPGQSGKFAHVSVMVARPDLEKFKAIPTDSSGSQVTLYGRVEYDIGSNFRFLRLLGRNATTDSSGNATITW